MAIIDTSKGVRPCVEELARLENNRILGKNKHSITRSFTYEDKVLREYQSRGLKFSYAGNGLFKIEGTTTSNWTSSISILYGPDNCPIIGYDYLQAPFMFSDQPDSERKLYRHYFLVDFTGRANIITPDESTAKILLYLYGSYSIPCTDGTTLNRSILVSVTIGPSFVVSALTYVVPYSVTPIFEEMTVAFQLYWSSTGETGLITGTTVNLVNCFNIYNLFSYFTPEAINDIYLNSSGDARLTKILTGCDVLDYINMDNLLNGLYTMSNGALKTISFNLDKPNQIFPPRTEAYIYEPPTPEGE